ncbi:ATP-binding protein [Prosthecomicrobium pneumaticum]|uniref:histidine kinase n=1 Tax=Prosthecomicrobium pneumaticum TaxID=81895 RepID=A0A7W9FME5_9HYPH|nr:ATP-binding protein [Prosthecomicrobium pneumaticum]MBB5753330.1 two-component system phosphate regulon sensor histidine kinase PhoR [Prosthecomicrobium pneumaticum]
MSEGDAEETGMLGRLRAVRFRLAAIVLIVAAFALAGTIEPPAALLLAAIMALLCLAPAAGTAREARLPKPAAAPTWPELGVKSVTDALPYPCFVLDRRGVVRYGNTLAQGAFPIRPGDPLSFRLRAPDLVAAFERVAAGGAAERVTFSERVPTERWYDAWFAGLDPRSNGLPAFVVLVFQDLTEQRRLERVRADFVANASHELRTPLASLSGFIETLQGPARDDAEARRRFLAIMHEQASRMSRLIDDLLSLSRIEMKAHMRPQAPVDLAAVLRHVVDSLEPLARDNGVAIETEGLGTPVTVAGDRDELVQVFENLVENACKYGQGGGRVEVTLRPGAGERKDVTVAVRDFGPGIAEEHLPRLTERFYRIDVQASRAIRGTGLGLAIVKHILARHRGRLTIESRLGEGARFTVHLPAAASRDSPARSDNSLINQ